MRSVFRGLPVTAFRGQLETDGCLHTQRVTVFIRIVDYLHLIVNHYTEYGSPLTLPLAGEEEYPSLRI
jgi:hypothetical protein